MNERVNFLFDVVVTHLEMYGKVFAEPLELLVNLKFMGKTVKLTSSRVNVGDFVANRELEILSTPERVRQSLEDLGISMAVNYQGSTLGNGTMTFDTVFLDKISPTMNDLLHEDTVEIKRRVDIVGTVSILLRLTLKCDEAQPSTTGSVQQRQTTLSPAAAPDGQEKKSRVSCASQEASINAQDMMFLFGYPDPLLQIPSDPCSELPEQEGDERLRLDLQRYKSLNNRRVTFPQDDPCVKEKPSFSALKKLTEEYSQIIDSVTENVKQLNPPTSTEAATDRTVGATPRPPKDERWIPVPLRSESEELQGVKPIRFCPACLYPMSWLPKYMPCPSCNTKPRPVLVREDPPLTAGQIMAEQLVRPRVTGQGDKDFCFEPCASQLRKSEEDECLPRQCTCTVGKICAHCRIRRMCEDIYQSTAPTERGSGTRETGSRVPEPRSDEDFCVIAESEDDDLPYLSRVFSELKSLYQLHDSKKLKALQQRCQSQTLLPRRTIKELTDDLYQGGRTHTPPGRTPDQRLRAGHKRCLPPNSVVSRHHGWNWSTSSEARTKGWRPGAILRACCQIMRHFLLGGRYRNLCRRILCEDDHRRRMPDPVLRVSKQNGEIFVTLRPLPTRDMRQKPITFRIVKSQLAVALRQIKRALKDQGFEKCTCHKSLMLCTCRNAFEKIELNKALRTECRRRLMEPCPDQLVLTDTSISDLEFDFEVTPPAGTKQKNPPPLPPKAVDYSTQTSKKDRALLPPKYPMAVPPYYRGFDCALGDRYMGTAFGWPGEQVFEDGIFGLGGGGPHGPNPMPCGRMPRLPNVWGGSGGTEAGGRAMWHGGRGHRMEGAGGGGWKGFPGAKAMGKGRKGDQTKPIPVRYPKRFLKLAQDAAKATKETKRDAVKKNNISMQEKGTLERPRNPNEGKDTRPRPNNKEKGSDHLTASQRKQKMLLAFPGPNIDQIPRRAKGYDPCAEPYRVDIIC